jgi:hypothetical protein
MAIPRRRTADGGSGSSVSEYRHGTEQNTLYAISCFIFFPAAAIIGHSLPADSASSSNTRTPKGSKRTWNVKVTRLAQILGQLSLVSNSDSQSNCWANLRILGPVNFAFGLALIDLVQFLLPYCEDQSIIPCSLTFQVVLSLNLVGSGGG